jgi:uroporphyrinogen-III decarboxylase
MLVGDETLALWTVEQRDLLREMLDVFSRRLERAVRQCLEKGVGPIYYFNGPEYALPPLMSPRDFDEFVVPYDTRLISLIHSYPGRYVIVHSHGRVNRFLERFADMGTDGLNVLEPPPLGDVLLAEAKQRVGDRLCLIGNIQYDDLARCSLAEVGRFVREAIQAGAPGGGFILSPCACPYERPWPPMAARNFIEYLRRAREYGA